MLGGEDRKVFYPLRSQNRLSAYDNRKEPQIGLLAATISILIANLIFGSQIGPISRITIRARLTYLRAPRQIGPILRHDFYFDFDFDYQLNLRVPDWPNLSHYNTRSAYLPTSQRQIGPILRDELRRFSFLISQHRQRAAEKKIMLLLLLLVLTTLKNGLPAITPAYGEALASAGAEAEKSETVR